MSLSFLPEEVKIALNNLNFNLISEIRLRRGQPVIIEYNGVYEFLGRYGLAASGNDRIVVIDIDTVLNAAAGGCIYGYTEQMKNGFITVEHGVRIGIAGEYVTENGFVNAIKSVTSLNIRVPHDVTDCSELIVQTLFQQNHIPNLLIFSKPGLGKTTILRDLSRKLSKDRSKNVLIFDERGEISAIDAYGDGFDLGTVDVVRCHNKLGAIANAVRAMKPSVIITDELYGDGDNKAVQYAVDCGISVIASSHVTNAEILMAMPFDYYAELREIGGNPKIYDKNFNSVAACGRDNFYRRPSF